MPEMLSLSSIIVGKGQGDKSCPSDRRSLLRWYLRFGCRTHCSRSSGWWPIAYLRTGDIVTVDQDTKEISMAVSDEELAKT